MFKAIEEAKIASECRIFKTTDIVKRLGIIDPKRLHLKNYPIGNPVTVFNPSITVEDNVVKVYARVIFGYYMYVSAVAMFELDMNDLLSGYVNTRHYSAELVIYPNTRYDFWGTEDPRVYKLYDNVFMTYCGRTINYFNPAIRIERTLPVTAISSDGKKWRKCCVFTLPKPLRKDVISDKDAFLHLHDNKVLLFHRPHMSNEKFYLTVSKVPLEDFQNCLTGKEIREVEVQDTIIILEPAKFELKLGWSTPPVKVSTNEYVVLIHGVDKYVEAYRVFAVLLRVSNGDVKVLAVTPHYIMEPKTMYEVFGDRPYVVFPCGIARIDNKLLISYGAADSMIGFGEIELDLLLSIFDKGRIE